MALPVSSPQGKAEGSVAPQPAWVVGGGGGRGRCTNPTAQGTERGGDCATLSLITCPAHRLPASASLTGLSLALPWGLRAVTALALSLDGG